MKNHCREEGSLFPRKGESGILSDQPLEEPAFRAAVEGPGHQVLAVKRALYQKKVFFLFGKGGKGAAVPEHTVQGGADAGKSSDFRTSKKEIPSPVGKGHFFALHMFSRGAAKIMSGLSIFNAFTGCKTRLIRMAAATHFGDIVGSLYHPGSGLAACQHSLASGRPPEYHLLQQVPVHHTQLIRGTGLVKNHQITGLAQSLAQ